MSRFFSLFLISCLAYISPISAQKGCCDDSFSKGFDAFHAKKYDEAIRLFSQGKTCDKKCIHDFDALIKRVKKEQKAASTSKTSQIPVQSSTPSVSTAFIEPQMVKVEGGTFQMGQPNPDIAWKGSTENEQPVHSVSVSSFSIGKYEVTQAEWRYIMGKMPKELTDFKGDNLPVYRVIWSDIQEFLQKINAKTGKKYRLPTEEEWEFAARGGNKSKGYTYPGSNDVKSVAWMGENSDFKIHPVGQLAANELGIYDMAGNVNEFCQDWYKGYTGSSGVSDYTGYYRVIRGGNWAADRANCHSTRRFFDESANQSNGMGFRLALSSN